MRKFLTRVADFFDDNPEFIKPVTRIPLAIMLYFAAGWAHWTFVQEVLRTTFWIGVVLVIGNLLLGILMIPWQSRHAG